LIVNAQKHHAGSDTSPKTSVGASSASDGGQPSPTGRQRVKAKSSSGAAHGSTPPALDTCASADNDNSIAASLAKARATLFGLAEPIAAYLNRVLLANPDEPPMNETFCSAFGLVLRIYGEGERISQVEIKVRALDCRMVEQQAKISASVRQNRDA
jgi:hypothetical protein